MLEIKNIYAAYGQVPVLMGVDLELRDNEILVLLGRNGVGKTTLMRVAIGLLKPSKGTVELNRETISGLPVQNIARRGMAYVPQGRGIFPKLTVGENLILGTRATDQKRPVIPEEVFEYFPFIKERIKQFAGTLSGGEQQMLALGRALCSKPRIMLLDEPSEGIQPSIVQRIGEIILDIVEKNKISVLLVEQNMEFAVKVAHRCIVMEKGRIVHEGKPDEFQNENIIKEFLAI